MWKKLKWWQWLLVVFFGIGILNTIIGGPPPSPKPNEKRFASANAEFKLIAGDATFSMTFNEGADPNALPDLAREQCGNKSWCNVLGWTDPKFAARGMPMTDREVRQLAFSYQLNRATSAEQVLWNCSRWKRRTSAECMAPAEPE